MRNREKICTVFVYFGKWGLEIWRTWVYNIPYDWMNIFIIGRIFLFFCLYLLIIAYMEDI